MPNINHQQVCSACIAVLKAHANLMFATEGKVTLRDLKMQTARLVTMGIDREIADKAMQQTIATAGIKAIQRELLEKRAENLDCVVLETTKLTDTTGVILCFCDCDKTYVTWKYNIDDVAKLYNGHYDMTLPEAIADYEERDGKL